MQLSHTASKRKEAGYDPDMGSIHEDWRVSGGFAFAIMIMLALFPDLYLLWFAGIALGLGMMIWGLADRQGPAVLNLRGLKIVVLFSCAIYSVEIFGMLERTSALADLSISYRLLIVGALGAIAFIAASEGYRASKQKPKVETSHEVGSPLDQTILLECGWAQPPEIVPAFGYYELLITDNLGFVGMSSTSHPAGSKFTAVNSQRDVCFMKCRLTNFGNAPVLNVEADLTFDYLETIHEGANSRSGKTLKTVEVKTPRAQLGAVGSDNIFEFYVSNQSFGYVNLLLPKTIRVQAVGTVDWQTATLVPPKMGGQSLWPMIIKPVAPNPPVEPSLTQSPPDTATEKRP